MSVRRTDEDFKREYLEAMKYLNDVDYDKCAEIAKQSLTDPGLPQHWKQVHSVLCAMTCDDWEDAESYRAAAEVTWKKLFDDAQMFGNDVYITALNEMRGVLDKLEKAKKEYDEAMLNEPNDSDGDDEKLAKEMDGMATEKGLDQPDVSSTEDEFKIIAQEAQRPRHYQGQIVKKEVEDAAALEDRFDERKPQATKKQGEYVIPKVHISDVSAPTQPAVKEKDSLAAETDASQITPSADRVQHSG